MMRLNGKQVVLDQLQAELQAAGLDVSAGLGTFGDWIFPYDKSGNPVEFVDATVMNQVLAAHAPTREMNTRELRAALLDAQARGDNRRIQQILAMSSGIIPRDRVPL